MAELTETSSPSANKLKGKGKEPQPEKLPAMDWELGWEQVQAIVDGNPKALAWTQNNVVVYGHAYLPRVCARFIHPNASTPTTPFDLINPPLSDFATTYGPPSLLSAQDNWVFAYFPPALLSDGDGVGCIWQGTSEIGSWSIAYWWRIQRGHSPVACQWLGPSREWLLPPGQSRPRREPRAGPLILKMPMLLLVTRTNYIELVHGSGGVRPIYSLMRAPLRTSWACVAGAESLPAVISAGHGGTRICVKAAIGLASDSESIVVATISRLFPRLDTFSGQNVGPLNITELSQPQTAGPSIDDISWENWGQESVISLCEVRVNTVIDRPTMEIVPIPSISMTSADPSMSVDLSQEGFGSSQLSHLAFTNYRQPHIKQADEVKMENESEAPVDEVSLPEDDGILQLVACFVDFADYTASPRSSLQQWTFQRKTWADQKCSVSSSSEPPSAAGVTRSQKCDVEWVIRPSASRLFTDEVVSMIQPCWTVESQHLCIATLKLSGKVMAGRADVVIGAYKTLTPTLADDEDYQDVALIGHRDTLGVHPNAVAISPNRALIALAPMHSSASGLTIIRAPQRRIPMDSTMETEDVTKTDRQTFAPHLALSSLKNSDANDIYRAFWSGNDATPKAAVQLIRDTWSILRSPQDATQKQEDGKESAMVSLRLDWTSLGMSCGLFKASPMESVAESGAVALSILRLRMTMEALSNLVPIMEFPDNGTDNALFKRLMKYVTRHIQLCETVVKEAVIWEAWRACGQDKMGDSPDAPKPSDILLLLMHPQALSLMREVLERIRNLPTTLNRSMNPGRKAFEAMLTDSKVDLHLLAKVFEDIGESNAKAFKEIPEYSILLREASFSLAIPSELRPALNTCTELINNRPHLSQKMALLVPSLEYPDAYLGRPHPTKTGVLRARVVAELGTPLYKVCLRCGEDSESKLHDLMSFHPWGAFERNSKYQCWCGGRWMAAAPPSST